jgi:opacity protein-like surface antigen
VSLPVWFWLELFSREISMTRFVVAASILAASALSASAADLPARSFKAPPPAAPAHSWSGCYVGIQAGGGSGHSGIAAVTVIGNGPPAAPGLPFTNDFNQDGSLAGETAGCNYQTGHWVFGIEGDVSWTDQNGTANNIVPFATNGSNHLQENWFDTVRGRIGYAWDSLLVYGAAGAAFAGTSLQFCQNGGCLAGVFRPNRNYYQHAQNQPDRRYRACGLELPVWLGWPGRGEVLIRLYYRRGSRCR